MRSFTIKVFSLPILLLSTGVATFVLIWLSWRYTDTCGVPALTRFSALVTAVAAVGSLSAFVMLLLYTKETIALRKVAERQLSATYHPLLVLDCSGKAPQLAMDMEIKTLALKNIGTGPALNIHVIPFDGNSVRVSLFLKQQSYLEQGSGSELSVHILEEGSANGFSGSLARLANLFKQNKLGSGVIHVMFEALDGRRYSIAHDVEYDPSEKRICAIPRLPAVDASMI